eukprot:XP_003976575.1 PREDICTED: ceramide kinase-like isoform X1 [Takifugu rubripes]
MTGLSEDMEKQARLLSSQLVLDDRLVEVAATRTVLAWKGIKKDKKSSEIISFSKTEHVPLCDIIAAHKNHINAESGRSQKNPKRLHQMHPHAFTVSYVRRTRRRRRWRCGDVTFHCTNQGLCEQWIQVINEQLSLFTNRPRSLLVYINPYGGKRRGERVYEQKVAPLLRHACISADVIVTERANHARDHLISQANLNEYDGVVCVGGDGMFSEILHGLIIRTQTDHRVDRDRPDSELVPCSLRVGIIPAGSTDCICFSTVGASDAVTSALHIIVGDSQPMDVGSVHHRDCFLRYSVSLLGYGFYGDVLTDSERNRRLGPARYDLAGVKTFLSHKHYEGTISFLPAENKGTPRDKLRCRSGCGACQHKSSLKDRKQREMSEKTNLDKDGGHGWRVIHGKFIAINAASMSCACPRSPKGLAPSAHLADGTADLILVRRCSHLDFFRHLLRHTTKDDQFDHSFVEVHRVRKFCFQPRVRGPASADHRSGDPVTSCFGATRPCPATGNQGNGHGRWTCDGEILPHAAIRVSVHGQLIRLFARGIEEEQRQQGGRAPEGPCSPRDLEPS